MYWAADKVQLTFFTTQALERIGHRSGVEVKSNEMSIMKLGLRFRR